MPIPLERGAGIGRAAPLRRIGSFPIPPETAGLWSAAGRKLAATPPPPALAEDSSSDSSSIGVNSDGESEDEEEVQSVSTGPLEVMEALEEALPIRQGISDFYRGKSKSFTSLADAMSSCSSSKDLAKQETAYTRKRRNLLALNCSRPLRSTAGRGISKKHPNSNKSTLALAVAMCNPGRSNNTNSEEEGPDHHWLLPPLHSQGKPTAASGVLLGSFPSHEYSMHIRSFSLTDLHGMADSSLKVKQGGEHKML